MQTASSANRTCRLWRSASEYTATVRIPNSLHAQMTRKAISPRLAMRIFLMGADGKQRLPVLHRLAVHYQLTFEDPGHFSLDLVHELHRLDDAQDFSRLDTFTDPHKGRGPGRGRLIKRPHDGRADQDQVWIHSRLFRLFLGARRSCGGGISLRHCRIGPDRTGWRTPTILLGHPDGPPDAYPVV